LAYRTETEPRIHEWGCSINSLPTGRNQPECLFQRSSLETENVCVGIYEDYILLASRSRVLGVPIALGSWDLGRKAFRHNPRIIQSRSVCGIRCAIDALLHHQHQPDTAEQPELKIRGYCGHNIYHYQSRYFAIPEGREKFEIEWLRSATSNVTVGHTISDVKKELDTQARQQQFPSQKILFIRHTSSIEVEKYLAPFETANVTVLSVGNCTSRIPPCTILQYKNREGRAADEIDVNTVSPELLDYLCKQAFDVVIIPYEGRSFWQGTRLEQFSSAIANCIVNVFPNGRSRMYRGEDVHRIQYNKSYLNSMFQHIPSIRGRKVLEVGCSDGLACDLLLCEEPLEITGVDVMETVGCAYKDPRIRYQHLDASILPFDDDSFDVCFTIATLEHCFDPIKVIEEMKRVTVPDGYCYIQAGPLYFSPFGHHMFGFFDDLPWAHLRLSPEELILRLERNGLGEKIQRELGKEAADYVHSMMHINHINGRRIREYGLNDFEKCPDIELLQSTQSYEGEDLLTSEIRRELAYMSPIDLVSHGFELVFRKK